MILNMVGEKKQEIMIKQDMTDLRVPSLPQNTNSYISIYSFFSISNNYAHGLLVICCCLALIDFTHILRVTLL